MNSPVPTSLPTFTRRYFLALTGVSAGVLALSIDAPAASADPLPDTGNLFSLGVASGAPRPDGLVLWTRLAPEPLAEDGHGGMPLLGGRLDVAVNGTAVTQLRL